MKNINTNLKHTLFLALVIAVGLLFLPDFFYTEVSSAQEENLGISSSFYYSEPTSLLEDMKLVTTEKTEITTNNVYVSGVDVWQGIDPLYLVAIHYTDFNNDEKERRFVFVVRSSSGDPWIIADMSIENPDGASDKSDQTDRTIWFDFDVDKTILQSDPKIDPSWFIDATSSLIEVGVVDQGQINISGFGELTADEKASLTPLYKIADISVFDP